MNKTRINKSKLLTRQERYNLYNKMEKFLVRYQRTSGHGTGFCYASLQALTQTQRNNIIAKAGYIEYIDVLPEIKKRKPKNPFDYGYWFDTNQKGLEKRIAILKKAKRETR